MPMHAETRRAAVAYGAANHTGILLRLLHLFALRSSRRHLARLDDHMLRDVGITRDEADAELVRPLWDVPAGWRR